jgi:ANTAR domain
MDFPAIEAAKSALMARWKWDEPRAHRRLQRSAMEARVPKNAVAALVTEAGKNGRWDQLTQVLTALKKSRPGPPQQRRSASASTTINVAIAAAERSMTDVSGRSPAGARQTPEATSDQTARRAG